MRVYIPLTLPGLRAAVAAQQISPIGGVVFAVTDDLRAEYPGADEEELEYLAMSDAARASLRLIAADGTDWLRVVAAADVDGVIADPDRDRAAGRFRGPVTWRQLAAVHVDSADAAEDVKAAALVVDAADLGDDDAEFAIGTVQDIDLAWYAPGEIQYLIEDVE